jgi:hypothetical protein
VALLLLAGLALAWAQDPLLGAGDAADELPQGAQNELQDGLEDLLQQNDQLQQSDLQPSDDPSAQEDDQDAMSNEQAALGGDQEALDAKADDGGLLGEGDLPDLPDMVGHGTADPHCSSTSPGPSPSPGFSPSPGPGLHALTSPSCKATGGRGLLRSSAPSIQAAAAGPLLPPPPHPTHTYKHTHLRLSR